MPTVVGIDPSLQSTGLAIIRSEDDVELHRVRSSGKEGDTLAQRQTRLDDLAGHVVRLVRVVQPDLVVIESPTYSGKSTGHMHDRSGVWWLIVFALLAAQIPVVEVSNTARAKYATGKGSGPDASKDAVLTAVVRRYPNIQVRGNDEADALILASMGMRALGMPIEASLPQANLDAMKTLVLP